MGERVLRNKVGDGACRTGVRYRITISGQTAPRELRRQRQYHAVRQHGAERRDSAEIATSSTASESLLFDAAGHRVCGCQRIDTITVSWSRTLPTRKNLSFLAGIRGLNTERRTAQYDRDSIFASRNAEPGCWLRAIVSDAREIENHEGVVATRPSVRPRRVNACGKPSACRTAVDMRRPAADQVGYQE